MQDYAAATRLAEQALRHAETHFGPESPVVFNALRNLADLRRINREFEKAESLAHRALVISEKGNSRFDEALVLAEFLQIYCEQRKTEQAAPLVTRLLALLESSESKIDPHAQAVLYWKLANSFDLLHDRARAELYLKRSQALLEKELGPFDPEVARILNNLGVHYDNHGHYKMAESYYRRSLAIFAAAYGKDHFQYAAILHNLANHHFSLGRLPLAEETLKRTLAIWEQDPELNALNIAQVRNSLADVYRAKNNLPEARTQIQLVLKTRLNLLGPDHVLVAKALHSLGWIAFNGRRYQEAGAAFERALLIREQTLPPDDTELAQSMDGLAVVYSAVHKREVAIELFLRAIDIYKKALGTNHPLTAESIARLAETYSDLGRKDEAKESFLLAHSLFVEAFGPDHRSVINTDVNIGTFYRINKEFAKAERHINRALAALEGSKHRLDADFASALSAKGQLSYEMGNFSEAESYFRRALALRRIHQQEDLFNLVTALGNLAETLRKLSRTHEAASLKSESARLEKALK
jgi:tetratricopeptide (TPR) repeat protein